VTTETEVLVSYLDAQRRHVLGILEGLDEEGLRRAVLPSGWSCAGLVRHLALDVERFWFRAVIAGQREAIESLVDDGWQVPAGESGAAMIELYRREIALADEVIGSTPLAATPAWWPADQFGDWRLADLRETLAHVLAETACHAGHLDAARELIDGKRWLVLTE
jgi:Protein of unknown function (DUF664)